jgi:cell division protease FtsH
VARREREARRRRHRWIALGVSLAVVASAATVFIVRSRAGGPTELRLDEFQAQVSTGDVRSATVNNGPSSVEGELSDGTRYRTVFPEDFGEQLTTELLGAGVRIDARNDDGSVWEDLLLALLPVLLIVGVFLYFLQQVQGGGKAAKFARTRARTPTDEHPVTFDDVAGADEAVEELGEVVEFLRDPDRFASLGARIPKGILLVGPPGTGKTLLARAVAGEAGVPFFSISGSDFVELFVGVGASRVRDLFRQAQAESPAIVFIDEIDAVGRQRGAGLGGGHDEREQTLNQLLVQMDGFDAAEGTVLLAATNRPDILDPALLRPGRFDRRIVVDAPDVAGRTQILGVHTQGKPVCPEVDLEVLARRTPGFTGADLANVVNEGALLAARRGSAQITGSDLVAAVDRVVAGPERRSRIMSARDRRTIAIHESGHAVVSHVLPNAHPVHKISIVSRGQSLGQTVLLPEEDTHLHRRAELEDRLAVLLGGRAAEEVFLGEITSGAADDIDQATKVARAMVTELGMSEKLGPQRFSDADSEPFLGREQSRRGDHSDELAARIDEEVSRLIADAYDRARRLVEEHRATLEALSEALLEHETLDDEMLDRLLDGGTVAHGDAEGPR